MSVLSPKAESLLNTLAIQPGVTQQHMARQVIRYVGMLIGVLVDACRIATQ